MRATAAGTPKRAERLARKEAALNRQRRSVAPEESIPPSPPSTLSFDSHGSAARTGQAESRRALRDHPESGPALTGGDVDADWQQAYSSGDEAPGGDNPTPDQDIVEEIGRSLGVKYDDTEELRGAEKIADRDRRRWELDPASSEDYTSRIPPKRKK